MKMKTLRLGLALLGAGTALMAGPASAQIQQNFYREDAGTALTRHLRTLSEQPRSVSALLGAGKAALELGDPQAALTFFARAEEIAPRDGHVKAGMGSAFVAMEQPRTALRLFTEAAGLGVAEHEFAGDRGLVHDLAGDPRRAQADYSLALSRRDDDEVRRRLALSFAISGERDRALATIDAQLRRQDRAAWRTRAFILALAGDAQGATQLAQSTMPMQAAQLQPFFSRLPSLNAAQRAMAVHFGHFPEGAGTVPGAGTQYAGTQYAGTQYAGTQYAGTAPASGTARSQPTQAGRPDPRQVPLATRQGETTRSRPATATNPSRQGAPRVADRLEAEPSRSALDWSGRYGRPRAVRPTREAAPQPPANSGAMAAAPRAQAPASAQPALQAPASSGGAGLTGLARNLPADVRAATPRPAPSSQTAPVRMAEARPAPPATAPALTQPVQSAPAVPPPAAASVPSSLPAASLALPPSQPVQVPPPAAATQTSPSASAMAAVSAAPVPQQPSLPTQPSSAIAPVALSSSQPAQQNLVAAAPQPPAASSPPQPLPSARSFADIAAAIASLPTDPGGEAATPAPQPQRQVLARLEPTAAPPASTLRAEPKTEAPKAPAAAKSKAETPKTAKESAAKEAATDKAGTKKPSASSKEATAKKVPAAPKEASRHWVQIAGGANEAAMTSEFNRLKGKAPKLLGSRVAWTTPLRATNRLLVGPFKTPKEAQDFVNELAKLDLSAFSWTSPAGQEIAKLSAK